MTGRRPLRVVIAGGGVAGLETLLALRDLAEERVAIQLVAPEETFSYRPLEVGAPFALGKIRRYAIEAIAAARGARFRRDALARVAADVRRAGLASGEEVAYDALVVAAGVRAVEAIPGAVTYRGARDAAAMRGVLQDVAAERARTLVFAVPPGVSWPLPLYELALMTATTAVREGRSPAITLVSPEDRPLALFGRGPSDEVRSLLEERGIAFLGSAHASRVDGNRLLIEPGHDPVEADRVVALPRLVGPAFEGLPSVAGGFVRADAHGRVHGCEGIWAAGDAVDFPVKQGGIAAQQADAVAEDLAARSGAPVIPRPFRPVLRGMLFTGEAPKYMRASIAGGAGEDFAIADHPLWWPPSKIAGRYLAPYLGAADDVVASARDRGGIPVEVALEREWTASPAGW